MTLFLVDRHAPGVDVVPDRQDRPQRGRVVRDDATTTSSCPSRIGSARRARASGTCCDGLNAERILIAAEALGIGACRAAPRRRVRERAGRVRPADRQEPGHRVPARRGARQAARRRPDGARGGDAARRRPAVRRGGQPRQVPRRRGRRSSPPTGPCRPTAASGTPPSTTSSGTSARPACHGSRRSARS